ncbi:MAG: acyclic terpene utilization AtuA family protein [Candidatus Nanopelagicales bacterium]|nr:acyclic terpene utilization AtuA family protein [Candidatus Nanopelagicales bacterium]
MTAAQPRRPVRIANCSGFFGDRLSAAQEMVSDGPIDVLTGDWLAELTMLILARQRMKHGAGSGYARTFLAQMEQVLGSCLDRDIRVVTNAGGLDPAGLASALRTKAGELGLSPSIAVVTGDDLAPRMKDLTDAGERWVNLDTGEEFASLGVPALTANAYIGGRGISTALAAGADVVITGRCTDAALVVGPAAWWHGWDYDDPDALDKLAGSIVAGHVIECGAQATGGNYAFFEDVPEMEHIGFPIAEVAASGDSVITKHADTGGMVTVGTVTAQLLYEIGAPCYLNPDATADFGSIHLTQVGRDRVRISGVRGLPPPETLKVSLNYLGGFRNTFTLVLTGLNIEEKAELALRTIAGIGVADLDRQPTELAAASRLNVAELSCVLIRGEKENPASLAEGQAFLRISVKDPDPKKVGKAFTAPAVECALASYPGMFPTTPPGEGTPYGVYWPTTVRCVAVPVSVTVDDGRPTIVRAGGHGDAGAASGTCGCTQAGPPTPTIEDQQAADLVTIPLGWVVGARSGDKGGNANIGLWIPDPVEVEAIALAAAAVDSLIASSPDGDVEAAWQADNALSVDEATTDRADAAYAWMCEVLADTEKVWHLLPDARDLEVQIHRLPNLRATNLVIKGILGRGVSENTSLDPQAKGLGELLRARLVNVPRYLLDRSAPR